jgi:hypothetical protein
MGRVRMYASAARRQAAYRERRRGALRFQGPAVQGNEKNGAGAVCGAVVQHAQVSGLLLRITEDLPGERVRAVVVAPGQSGLLVGVAYPFRRAALVGVQS